jgi:hypothetical protein
MKIEEKGRVRAARRGDSPTRARQGGDQSALVRVRYARVEFGADRHRIAAVVLERRVEESRYAMALAYACIYRETALGAVSAVSACDFSCVGVLIFRIHDGIPTLAWIASV